MDPSSSLHIASHTFEVQAEDVIKKLTQQIIPLQKKAYQCSLHCFDTNSSNVDTLSQCIQACQSPVEIVGNRLRQEIDTLQNQITSCQQACHSKYSMAFNNAKTSDERQNIQMAMERCSISCFEDTKQQFKSVESRMMDFIKSQKI